MTEPKPTPEEQNLPASPATDANSSTPERDGFFRRVQRAFKPEPPPVHPSEAAEIVVDSPPPIRRKSGEEA
jgi:hypothetical protein